MFRRIFGGLNRATRFLGACAVLTALCTLPACTRPESGQVETPAATATAATETPAAATEATASAKTPSEAASPSGPGDTSSQGKENEQMASQKGPYRGLTPFRDVKAPEITEVKTVRFQTDAGDLTIEIYPQAAPNAAKRFLELVEAGFYNETPIFRIVPGFVAQFGANWRGDFPQWQRKNFNDDPSLFRLGKGTLAFAKAGPNTNSTQVFINYADNSTLREQGGFTTFGMVVEGFEKTAQFKQVGDPSMGLDQGRLWSDGGRYLEGLRDKPTMILKAEVVPTEG